MLDNLKNPKKAVKKTALYTCELEYFRVAAMIDLSVFKLMIFLLGNAIGLVIFVDLTKYLIFGWFHTPYGRSYITNIALMAEIWLLII